MMTILYALTSTFTSCTCGCNTADCAIMRMAAFLAGASAGHPACRLLSLNQPRLISSPTSSLA